MEYSDLSKKDLLEQLRKAHERISELEQDRLNCSLVEAALRENENNFSHFFESMSDPLWVCTPDGGIYFTNTAATTTLGYSLEELCSMNVLDVHPVDKRQEAGQIFTDMLQGFRKTCPLPLAHKDGSLVPVETRIWKSTWNGVECVCGISKNLTAEQESLQRFERLFRSNPTLMALSSLPDRRIVDVNDSWTATTGFSREEAIGRTTVELGIIGDLTTLEASSEEVLLQGKFEHKELQITCKDGATRSGIFSGEVIQSQGKSFLLSVMVDITERKAAEEKLKRQSALINALLDSIPDIIFFKDIDGIYIGCNPQFAEFVGRSKEEIMGKTDYDLFVRDVAADFRNHDVSMLAQGRQRKNEEYITYPDGSQRLIETLKSPYWGPDGELIGLIGISRDITDRKRSEVALQEAYSQVEKRVSERTEELASANALLQIEVAERQQAHREINQILSSISAVLIGLDKDCAVTRWNQAAQETFGLPADTVVGRHLEHMELPGEWRMLVKSVELTRASMKSTRINNVTHACPTGVQRFHVVTITPLLDKPDSLDGFLVLGEDISEMKFFEAQLGQAANLEAIGQLAAGIAHEINTPVQFIGDSMTFLQEACDGLQRLAVLTERLFPASGQERGDIIKAIEKLSSDIDLEFILEEVPRTIERIHYGVDRVSSIVRAIKRFSHPISGGMRKVDIRESIESTLVISRNEWRYVAEVVTEFDPELEAVICNPAEINQVLLNIIVNAAYAIEEAVRGTSKKGLITITTRQDGEYVEICIQDTGPGIPENIRGKVFNLFFTTKEVGRGTGQGLAIAHDIVVNKHGGVIGFETVVGEGTVFHVRLPLRGQSETGAGCAEA